MKESSVLKVTGMKCGGCEANVTEKLTAVAGVISVTVSFKENQVAVEYNPERTNLDVIKGIITGAGFIVE